MNSFINGSYQFEPLKAYSVKGDRCVVWTYMDRLFVKALLSIIKPLFKHIISPRCLHIKGPSGVQDALSLTQKAFEKGSFRYFIRADIKGFYASIDRKILTAQVREHFDDARVLNYLEQIINIPVIEHGAIRIPRLGIHRRSSLSPFLGALYLSPLDKVFEKRQGIWYIRFMDDILILTKTKKQFCMAKRRLKQVLNQLKLRCSPRKTKMAALTEGFHFLGINFKVNAKLGSQETMNQVYPVKEALAQTESLQSQVTITLHERCCVRAMDKISVMEEDIVYPMEVRRYLFLWATWWSRAAKTISKVECLKRWNERARVKKPELAWVARLGLLPPVAPLRFMNVAQLIA